MEINHFAVIDGQKDVILSAPHVYPHKRPSLRGVLKQGEEYLDQVVIDVCASSHSYGIYLNQVCSEYDPNYQKLASNPYKQVIKDLILQKKINTVIDLHGLSNDHQYDIAIYYCIRFQKSKKLALEFLDILSKKKEFKGISFHIGYMAKNLQETVTEYVCEKLRKPAFQIEISRDIRKSPLLRSAFSSTLSEYITKI